MDMSKQLNLGYNLYALDDNGQELYWDNLRNEPHKVFRREFSSRVVDYAHKDLDYQYFLPLTVIGEVGESLFAVVAEWSSLKLLGVNDKRFSRVLFCSSSLEEAEGCYQYVLQAIDIKNARVDEVPLKVRDEFLTVKLPFAGCERTDVELSILPLTYKGNK